MYPRVIDQETFDKVKARTKVNHYGKRSVQTIYLLRNKLFCGHCGKPISAETGTNGSGEKVNYYKCIGIKKYQNGCIKQTIRQDNLEDFILNIILTELSKPKVLDILVKNLLKVQDTPNNNATINNLLKA